jgi:hypothetical protein
MLASLALSTAVPTHDKKGHGIEKDDFVHVKGLRLYDSTGLHYITGIVFQFLIGRIAEAKFSYRHELLGLHESGSRRLRWRELQPSYH